MEHTNRHLSLTPGRHPLRTGIVVPGCAVAHTVTADDGETFDVEVPACESVTFTAPEESGEFAFHCTPHPQMTETLVVG